MFLFSACGSSDPERAAADPAPPVVLGADTLIHGAAPDLPQRLARVALGQPRNTIEGLTTDAELLVPGYKRPFRISFDPRGNLRHVEYEVSADAVISSIEAAWGQGIASLDFTNEYTVWLNKGGRRRALLRNEMLMWGSYVLFSEFLGEGKSIGALDATEGTLLGLSASEIETHYGPIQRGDDEIVEAVAFARSRGVNEELIGIVGERAMAWVALPATEYSDVVTRVHFGFDDSGAVRHFWFDIPYGADEAMKSDIVELAGKKWGKSVARRGPMDTIEIKLSGGPMIRIEPKMEHVWQFHVLRPEPTSPRMPRRPAR